MSPARPARYARSTVLRGIERRLRPRSECAPHRPALLGLAAALLLLASPARAAFVDLGAPLTPLTLAQGGWVDYDNDGDLDIILTGDTGSGPATRLYRNDGGAFTPVATALPGVSSGAFAWGDYDNDGDVDLLLTGNGAAGYLARVYRNDGGGVFVDRLVGLPGVATGAVAWGDYDNDGHLDFVLSGATDAGRLARLYRNVGGGAFVDAAAGLRGVAASAVAWCDYDGDGDQDLTLLGEDSIFTHISRIYRNDGGGVFTDSAAPLDPVNNCAAAWGDDDADGDLDLALGGHMMDGMLVFHLYRNDGSGGLVDRAVPIPGLLSGSAAWGDADNDGDLDLLVTGDTEPTHITRLYRNDGGAFVDAAAGLPGVALGTAAWGDFDNDGDLDILLVGAQTNGVPLARVYRNDGPAANAPPGAPTHLRLAVQPGRLVFSWDAASDDHTPGAALGYNLRVGTTPANGLVLAPHADVATGFRRLAAAGNVGPRLSYSVPLANLPHGPLSWGVQAIDGAWRGGAFALAPTVSDAGEEAPGPPPAITLAGALPNPFRAGTTLRFALARPGAVRLEIFDAAGRSVVRLFDGVATAGEQTAAWAGRDARGRAVPAGVYWARLTSDAGVRTTRLVRVR